MILPSRTSPTAITPGTLVSSKYCWRGRDHCAVLKFSCDSSGPVFMKPLLSSAMSSSQLVFGSHQSYEYMADLVLLSLPLLQHRSCSWDDNYIVLVSVAGCLPREYSFCSR